MKETKQRELLEILVDEKNSEIARLYAQLKAKDEQLSNMDDQLRVKERSNTPKRTSKLINNSN